MKTYPNSPYFDDYDETKQFYKVLYRPGRPVQARELTQMQTLIQGQIERFGKNIFKEGSLVIPSEQIYDTRYNYVKLATTYNSIDADTLVTNMIGKTVVGQTTGVRALVVNATVSTESDQPTIFVKYLNSGTDGLTTVFTENEVLITTDSAITVQTFSTVACGTGTAFSIGTGAIFTKGTFAYFGEQTLIVSKYSTPYSIIIGFDIEESVVTSEDDSSLLDPAVGSYNYFAPGADRYKINLTLGTRNFVAEEVDDPNFVELIRVERGLVIGKRTDSQYNIINDTLARRTYDESGDYTVRPYRIKLVEHLRTTNANSIVSAIDGLYTSTEGGNSDLFVNVISAGKAYVKGYEIDSIRTGYINNDKARESVSITNGTIATAFGNYVYATNINSIPDLSSLAVLDLYDQYTATPASPAGNKVGTARVRHIDFYSGTPGTSTAVYKIYLFDITMNTGRSFSKDVKQLYYNNSTYEDFTADIQPTLATLTGTITTNTTTANIIGSGTRFSTELSVGNYVRINSGSYRVTAVHDSLTATVTPTPTANLVGINVNVESASIEEPLNNSYIFPLPYSVIKSVDSGSTATTYTTRRVYSRTLSGGNVSINAGTDEVFSGFSTDNYQLVVTSGANAGNHIDLTGKVTRSGVPTGKTITISLGGGYTSEDVVIITTVQKSASAADRKTKTLVTGASVDFTTQAGATAAVLSLGKADAYRLSNVLMSANAFGTAFSSANATEITNRYTFDNGQKLTHYDLGKVHLKSNSPKPTGPVRVYFDYFTHGSGDYFSVESYSSIDYEDIPTFSSGDVTYNLADCLDFRPRINDAGTGFTGSGSSLTEFLDFENDVITDYEYYLPRIDKLVIDRTGKIRVVKGISSLDPKEPPTPDDSMALFVLKQNAYVKDLTKDIEIIPIDNKRFTMRDIGRIENRVKNLEYYTSLSLAEKDAQAFQIKDALGFDRFKNGFVVDSFKGHGIGDAFNPDYAVAVDFNKNEARPLCDIKFVNVKEIATTNAARAGNNYVLAGDLFTLPYTEEVFIQNNKASETVNLNPFNIVLFNGTITLDPPADVWFSESRLPDVYRNVEGNYDTVVREAQSKGTWGTIWGSWRDLYYGNSGSELVQQREGIEYNVVETIDTTTNNDVVVSKTVIPKMRDIAINFTAEGLKPNTSVNVFFNDTNVTLDCFYTYNSSNATTALNDVIATGNVLRTDSQGTVSGVFYYTSTKYNLNTGTYAFKITDSASGSVIDQETFAQTNFTTSGELRNVANEIVSTRNATLTSQTVTDTRSVYVPPPQDPPISPPDTSSTSGGDPETQAPRSCPTYYGTLEVTGATSGGTVWGSNPYTDDSHWPSAAVHAGLISVGERAIISLQPAGYLDNYTGTTQNGVTTYPYTSGWCGATISLVESVRPKQPEVVRPSINDTSFVACIYNIGLGRSPELEGYVYWNDYFRNNGVTTGMLQAATSSTELLSASLDPNTLFSTPLEPATKNSEWLLMWYCIKLVIDEGYRKNDIGGLLAAYLGGRDAYGGYVIDNTAAMLAVMFAQYGISVIDTSVPPYNPADYR